MAATSMGASHLVLGPRAGMLYGPALLWLVVAVYLLKYPAFEFGPRYALATGESLIAGYAKVPGPGRWALWAFVVLTAAQGVGVGVAVTSIAASVLRVSLGLMPLSAWGVVVATVAAALLWIGRFPALESANKVMLSLLAVVTLVTFVASRPSAEAFTYLVRPSLPEGSVILAAAIVGWLPTGIDVSIWHSLWALKVSDRWEDREEPSLERRKHRLHKGLIDMRLGYAVSFVLAVIFLLLGTRVPATAATAPDGARVAVAISRAYAVTLGDWVVPVFMAAAFVGMFATAYIVMDGFPRALAEGARLLSRKRRENKEAWQTPYWVTLASVWLVTCVVHIAWPKPVQLATLAALLGLLVSPLYYALSYYCVIRHIREEEFAAGRFLRLLALVGIVFVTVATLAWLYLRQSW
jgi:Mn2+/Fe2+ NRAMP family transporter